MNDGPASEDFYVATEPHRIEKFIAAGILIFVALYPIFFH